MIKLKYATAVFSVFGMLLLAFCNGTVYGEDHIKGMDGIRTSMADIGNSLPGIIKDAKPNEIRTLERVFEINNYALVTIESYLKMIKVAVSSGGAINKEIVQVLNGWLGFMRNYCEYDIKYFDEVLSETKNEKIVELLKKEKTNMSNLKEISGQGIKENTELAGNL